MDEMSSKSERNVREFPFLSFVASVCVCLCMDIARFQVAFGGYNADNSYQHCDCQGRRFGTSAVGVFV